MTGNRQYRSDMIRGLALAGMVLAGLGIAGSWLMWLGGHDMSGWALLKQGLSGTLFWGLVLGLFAFMRSRVPRQANPDTTSDWGKALKMRRQSCFRRPTFGALGRRILMRRLAVAAVSVLLLLLGKPCVAGPYFRVRCSACGTTQTNMFHQAPNSRDPTLFSCGTGGQPGTFRMLVQCEKCNYLATTNMLQSQCESAWRTFAGDSKAFYKEMLKAQNDIIDKYSKKSITVEPKCPRCGGQFAVVYFRHLALPGFTSKEPKDPVVIPLNLRCASCSSNRLEAVEAGFHFD